MTEIDSAEAAEEQRSPALRAEMTALVDAMAEAAGSNRRLEEVSGASEATIRNFRRGRFPHSSTAKAEQLDSWAQHAMADHPGLGAPGSLADLLARWQGRPLADPGADALDDEVADLVDPAETAPLRRWRTPVTIISAVAVSVAVIALLAARLLDDGSEPSGVAGVRVDRDLTLDNDNFCGWRMGRDPIPLVSARPLVMRVDARCNAPAEPDPVKDVGATVYDAPSNDEGSARVGVIRTGNTFVPRCWARSSDVVADVSPTVNRSDIWILAAEPAGWVPDINLGGGYTAEQLRALELPECPSS